VPEIKYNDPYVPSFKLENGEVMHSIEINPEIIQSFDAVLITTDHSNYDWPMIVKNAKAVVDTRNATKGLQIGREKISKLGSGTRF